MEAYFDHPQHGAAVACDSGDAKKLISLGFILRDPQPEGARVPDWLKTAKPEPVVVAPIIDDEPVEVPRRRGRPPKA